LSSGYHLVSRWNHLLLPYCKIDCSVVYILCVYAESNNTEEEETTVHDFTYIWLGN
jgi:hypothetical protein